MICAERMKGHEVEDGRGEIEVLVEDFACGGISDGVGMIPTARGHYLLTDRSRFFN